MVAKTPTKAKQAAISATVNSNLVRETLNKVDRCMERLQELQCTVAGGTKVVGGVSLSPGSTRGYLRTSLRCKQESIRMKNATERKSPPGKFPAVSTAGEWRRMSLAAMILGETVAEILQANQFAKEVIVSKLMTKSPPPDPKTPQTARKASRKATLERTDELKLRRTKEKQRARRKLESPAASRTRSRINFKQISPPIKPSMAAYRVSPRNRPWVKKTVLFPNPAFNPSSSSSNSPSRQHRIFYKTRSPVLLKSRQQLAAPPHKFLVKSTNPSLRSQFMSKKAVPVATTTKNSSPPGKITSAKPRRCSFSPSRFANRLMSPLKSRMVLSPLKLTSSIQRSSKV